MVTGRPLTGLVVLASVGVEESADATTCSTSRARFGAPSVDKALAHPLVAQPGPRRRALARLLGGRWSLLG